jgi:hypothetical protein
VLRCVGELFDLEQSLLRALLEPAFFPHGRAHEFERKLPYTLKDPHFRILHPNIQASLLMLNSSSGKYGRCSL